MFFLDLSQMQQPYPNQAPPLASNQMRPAPVIPNQFGPPPTMPNLQFSNPQQQQQPPFPNQSAPGMGGAPQYQQNQYPGSQPQYNGPPSGYPPGGQPPPPPSGYPQQPNLAGPPSMPGSHMNGPSSYPGQGPPSGIGQQPYPSQPPQQQQPQQRIDPDMVPNVVRIILAFKQKRVLLLVRFKFLSKAKTRFKNPSPPMLQVSCHL